MRRLLAAILLSLAASAGALGQANAAAREELEAGARAYREGDFPAAERHFRRALELDPSQKNAPLFIARALQQQYKPGVDTPENIAAGERAAAAYRDILDGDPRNEDAFKSLIFLYARMGNGEKVREVLTERAGNVLLAGERRAEALTILASRQWQCSYDVTEQKENKTTVRRPDRVLVVYRMPSDVTEFYKARQCAAEGLRLVEQAVALDADSPNAWSYKANLLREASKLAEMEGDPGQKAEYDRQYVEALETQRRVAEEASKRPRAEGAEPPAPSEEPLVPVPEQRPTLIAPVAVDEKGRPLPDGGAPPPPPEPTPEAGAGARPSKLGGSFGVLNGRAVYKPEPEYPPAAKAAGVRGSVAVLITVDEEGVVAEAEAVSGHPLLREAAVGAARRARFRPTLLSGRPARVSGVVTYNFGPR